MRLCSSQFIFRHQLRLSLAQLVLMFIPSQLMPSPLIMMEISIIQNGFKKGKNSSSRSPHKAYYTNTIKLVKFSRKYELLVCTWKMSVTHPMRYKFLPFYKAISEHLNILNVVYLIILLSRQEIA